MKNINQYLFLAFVAFLTIFGFSSFDTSETKKNTLGNSSESTNAEITYLRVELQLDNVDYLFISDFLTYEDSKNNWEEILDQFEYEARKKVSSFPEYSWNLKDAYKIPNIQAAKNDREKVVRYFNERTHLNGQGYRIEHKVIYINLNRY